MDKQTLTPAARRARAIARQWGSSCKRWIRTPISSDAADRIIAQQARYAARWAWFSLDGLTPDERRRQNG